MRTFLVVAAAGLLLFACSGKSGSNANPVAPVSSSGDFTITLSFDPTPPKQGNETITVDLRDGAGNPVTGALVTIRTTMPQMSMAGPKLTAQGNSDGTYSAVTNMNFATRWVLDVTATLSSKGAKAEFTADVN